MRAAAQLRSGQTFVREMALREGVETLLRRYEEKETSLCTKTMYFHAPDQCSLSITDYFTRLKKYMLCSDACFIGALIYLNRVQRKDARVSVNNRSVHRFFLIAVVLAVKFLEEKYYTFAHYSKVGGVSARELNTLEAKFLKLIDFELFVSERDYQEYAEKLRDKEANMEV